MLLSKKTPFIFVFLLIIGIGIYFRFVNIDHKVYWGDESFTSLRLAGYTSQEFKEELIHQQPISAGDLQKYQYPPTETKENILEIVHDWAKDGVEYHPPLYFIMLRFWVQWLGNSVAVIRIFSALISLLAFPCIYWLCQELFNFPPTGWMAMILLAISPLHVLYAQEARPYSAFTLTILLASWVFLWANRRAKRLSWGLYAATVAIGIYTHVFFIFVVIAHGIYLVLNEGFRFDKKLKAYLLSVLMGLMLFLPWIITFIFYYDFGQDIISWTSMKVSHATLFKSWILNSTLIFFDVNDTFSFQYLLGYILVIFLSVYSLFYIFKNTDKSTRIFIFSLIGVTALSLTIPDLISGGIRSVSPRYLLAPYLGIQLSVAHLLATKIFSPSRNKWEEIIGKILTIILISIGLFSCLRISQQETWWNKDLDFHYDKVAKIVNSYERPLVVAHWVRLPSLSHILNPEVQLYSSSFTNVNSIADNFCDIFVYNYQGVMKEVQSKESQYQINKVYEWKKEISPTKVNKATLWHLRKPNCS